MFRMLRIIAALVVDIFAGAVNGFSKKQYGVKRENRPALLAENSIEDSVYEFEVMLVRCNVLNLGIVQVLPDSVVLL